MAKEFGTGRNFTFLRLNSKGELYQSSPEAKEGFTEIILDAGKPTEKKVYQKAYRSTDYGRVIFLGINEKNFPKGKVSYLEMSIQSDESENAVDVLQLQLLNTKGGLTDEVKKLIAVLPSLDYSRSIIVSSNREQNDRGYIDKILYFRYKAEEGQEKDHPIKFSLKFGEKGNIPMFIVKENAIDPSKKTYDYDDQDSFLSKILRYELKRYEDFKVGNVYPSEFYKEWETEAADSKTESTPTTTKDETKKVEENPFAAKVVDTNDDLPF